MTQQQSEEGLNINVEGQNADSDTVLCAAAVEVADEVEVVDEQPDNGNIQDVNGSPLEHEQ